MVMQILNDVKVSYVIAEALKKWRDDILNRDKDKFVIIDGREGSGKSTLALQLASAFDPEFNIGKVAFNAEQFAAVVKDPARKKGDCIVLDEGYGAINSRAAMTSVNRAMVQMGTEMRQLNLLVLVVLPSYFDLDRYYALWRTDCLLHVYTRKNGRRGRYCAYTFNKKKNLYLKGKQTYNYHLVKPQKNHGRLEFNGGYGNISDGEYRTKKASSFRDEKKDESVRLRKSRERSIILINALKEKGLTDKKIGEMLGVSRETINRLRNKPSEGLSETHIIINKDIEGDNPNGIKVGEKNV